MGGTESSKVARSKAKASKSTRPPTDLPKPRARMQTRKASMACTLCRNLRKKVCIRILLERTPEPRSVCLPQCIPVAGSSARCQRCERKDEVCRFIEVANDATAPRPQRRGRSVSSEVKPMVQVRSPSHSICMPLLTAEISIIGGRSGPIARVPAPFTVLDTKFGAPLGNRADRHRRHAAARTPHATPHHPPTVPHHSPTVQQLARESCMNLATHIWPWNSRDPNTHLTCVRHVPKSRAGWVILLLSHLDTNFTCSFTYISALSKSLRTRLL